MPLVEDGEDSLWVVLLGNGSEQVACESNAAHAAVGLLVHQVMGEVAGQQVWGVDQRLQVPARFDGFADRVDPFDQE